MLAHPCHLLTTHLMWTSAFIFLLTLGTAATPRSDDDPLQCTPLSRINQKKVRLPHNCVSEVFFRERESSGSSGHFCCYRERDKPSYSRQTTFFNCTDARNLKDFTVNNVQYLLITDKGRGVVTVIKLEEDNFVAVQTLQVNNAYSTDVVSHRGQLFLFIAVFDDLSCGQCDNNNLSSVYKWNFTAEEFNERPIQYLPSSYYVHWFYERYNNQSTFIVVLGRCHCPTQVHYWNRGSEQLLRIDQPDLESTLPGSDIIVQSVRDQRTEYILIVRLDRDLEYHRIRVFRWSTVSGMIPHGKLNTHVQDREGMSVLQHRGQVFLCTVSRGSLNEGRTKAPVFKVQFGGENNSHRMKEVAGVNTGDQPQTLSSCKLFVHPPDGELYAAIGYSVSNTKLMRYCPVTDRFRDAGELAEDTSVRDLVSFQNRDDFFIITARGENGQGKCAVYADDNSYS